jgi:hypothetical protein
MDLPPETIFNKYRKRWDIEQCNCYFKDVFNADSMYVHEYETIQGLGFVKELALEMYYRIVNLVLENKELDKNYSPAEIIEIAKRVRNVKFNSNWDVKNCTKKEQSLYLSLGITFNTDNRIKKKKDETKKPKDSLNATPDSNVVLKKKRGRPRKEKTELTSSDSSDKKRKQISTVDSEKEDII